MPKSAEQHIALLGQRLRIARLRRGWSATALAGRAGVHRNTLIALEKGAPGTTLGVCYAVLCALGLDHPLGGLADPDTDLLGQAFEAARRPRRGRGEPPASPACYAEDAWEP